MVIVISSIKWLLVSHATVFFNSINWRLFLHDIFLLWPHIRIVRFLPLFVYLEIIVLKHHTEMCLWKRMLMFLYIIWRFSLCSFRICMYTKMIYMMYYYGDNKCNSWGLGHVINWIQSLTFPQLGKDDT